MRQVGEAAVVRAPVRGASRWIRPRGPLGFATLAFAVCSAPFLSFAQPEEEEPPPASPYPELPPAPAATPAVDKPPPPVTPSAVKPSPSTASGTVEQPYKEGEEQTEEEPEDEPPATLFDNPRRIVFGGFGGVSVKYTRVLGTDAVMAGGEGAVLLNHALSIGAGGGGIANEINPTAQTRLSFGYGGLLVRYHFFSSEVVNFAVGTLVGGGGINVYDRNEDPDKVDWEKTGEAVFVVEPELGLYLNVTRWMRLGASGGYRFVSGVDKNDLSNTDVRGATGGLAAQFGWF